MVLSFRRGTYVTVSWPRAWKHLKSRSPNWAKSPLRANLVLASRGLQRYLYPSSLAWRHCEGLFGICSCVSEVSRPDQSAMGLPDVKATHPRAVSTNAPMMGSCGRNWARAGAPVSSSSAMLCCCCEPVSRSGRLTTAKLLPEEEKGETLSSATVVTVAPFYN
ncbi:hypothetical protein ACA910_011407 [Epithemia clementina (nom. ined.)]